MGRGGARAGAGIRGGGSRTRRRVRRHGPQPGQGAPKPLALTCRADAKSPEIVSGDFAFPRSRGGPARLRRHITIPSNSTSTRPVTDSTVSMIDHDLMV